MSDDSSEISRRDLLVYGGTALGTTLVAGTLAYRADRSFEDRDTDGIPDDLERSDEFSRFLEETFGDDQFDGLDPTRKDLLVDARYIGSASITDPTKRHIEALFRANGIHLQWLDHPDTYTTEWVEERYGFQVERLLWPRISFYADVVEDELKDTAVQVIVIPEQYPSQRDDLESIYAIHRGEDYQGVSLGNRCIVTDQHTPNGERRLVLHEIAHLGLCHDDDPDNTGVMGPNTEEAALTDEEWAKLRNRLTNVRDTTGADIALRECLREEIAQDLKDRVPMDLDAIQGHL